MVVNIIKLKCKLGVFGWRLLDEFSSFNKFPLISWVPTDVLLHVIVGLSDLSDGVFDVVVQGLHDLFLGLVGLVAQLFLHFLGHHSEKWEVNNIVRQVADFLVSNLEVLELLSDDFFGGLLLSSLILSVEEFLNQSLVVGVKDALIGFVLVQELHWSGDVLVENCLNLILGAIDPWEVHGDWEVRLSGVVKEWH
jgi:hypothetical protein